MRVFLDTNFKTVEKDDFPAVLEATFHSLEDQINGAPDLISLTTPTAKLPKGARSGDIVFSLAGGEIRIGVYNGESVSYASFGSFIGSLTDTQHGNRGGGTLHALATQLVAGFLDFADKVKLDHYKGDTSSAAPASTTEYPINGDYGFHSDSSASTYVIAKNKAGVIATFGVVTPAGVGTELQYRNGSSFGYLIGSTVSGANLSLAGTFSFGTDVILQKEGANLLGLRNGTNAQGFYIFNTWANSGTDFERVQLYWTGNTFHIRVLAGGTGITRNIYFNNAIGVSSLGHMLFQANNTYDIGTAAVRPKDVFANTFRCASFFFINAAGSVQARVQTTVDGYIVLLDGNGTAFIALQFGGTTSSFPEWKRVLAAFEARLADDSGYCSVASLYDRWGTGSPEAVVTAPVGATYHRTDGGPGTTIYNKETGTGNTGWVAVAAAGAGAADIKSATIDFGTTTPKHYGVFTIVDAAVLASSNINVTYGSNPAIYNSVDEWEMDPAIITAFPSLTGGSFTCNVAIQSIGGVVGTRTINYLVG